MKMEYSSDAVGVKLVHDKAEAVQHFDTIMNCLSTDYISHGLGLGHGREMMIMEYIKGTEHDIEVVIFKRKLVAAFVSDNGPTRPGSFTETAACMPSCLPEDKVGQLVTAAYQCCTEIGLVNGVFNVEMKMTQTGPKLIEINATMTGSYLRSWIQRCYDVDLVLCQFMVFCGIRPVIPMCKPKGQLMGVMCVPSLHKTVLQSSSFKTLVNTLTTQRLIRYTSYVEEEAKPQEEPQILDIPGLEVPLAHISVMAMDVDKAKASLLQVCHALRISSAQYEVASFVADFTDHIPLPLLVA
jgi:carnosine synthase